MGGTSVYHGFSTKRNYEQEVLMFDRRAVVMGNGQSLFQVLYNIFTLLPYGHRRLNLRVDIRAPYTCTHVSGTEDLEDS